VSERPTAANNADRPRLVDVARHDADFALAGRDDARTVGTDEPAIWPFLEEAHGPGHVEDGNPFGDRDDHANTSVGRLHDGVRRPRRHKDHAGVGPGLAHRLGHGIEQRIAILRGAALAGLDGTDDLRAVVTALVGVKRAGLAEALDEDFGVLVNEDAHEAAVP